MFTRRIHMALVVAAASTLGVATCAPTTFAADQGSNTPNQQNQQSGAMQSSQDQSSQNRSSQDQSAQGSQQAPEGYVIVAERTIMLTANSPQNHFMQAAEYLAQGDSRAAAAETRIAAGFLDMQSSRAKDSGIKQQLTSAAKDLRQVADKLQQQSQSGQQQGQQNQQANREQPQMSNPSAQSGGQQDQQTARAGQQGQQGQQGQSVQVPDNLRQSFAYANKVLAEHFQKLASNELQGKKAIMAGHDLDAAASSLRAAAVWSKQQPSQDLMTALNDANRLSRQLLTPGGQAMASSGDQQGQQGQQGQQWQTNNAQASAARSSQSEQQQDQQQANQRIPSDANKTVDQLASAIQNLQVGTQANSGQDQGSKPESASTGNE